MQTLVIPTLNLFLGGNSKVPLTWYMRDGLPQSSAVEWIDSMRGTLALIWEVAVAKEQQAKDKMATRSERKAKSRHFSKGDHVLVRVVEPGGKLGDRWDGPYEVEGKVADVTYKLSSPP